MSEINQETRDRKYNEWARRNPAIVSIVFPLLAAIYFYQKYTVELTDLRYIVGVILSFGSIIPALLFFFQSAIREISTHLVEAPLFLIFGRPAVKLLSQKNHTLSSQRKERILAKAIKDGISIDYSDADSCKEKSQKQKTAREAFERIREKCRENPIVFEFNCTYGFFRNLSGGLMVDLLICGCLAISNCKHNLGIEDLLFGSAVVLVLLLVFSLICTYTSQVRYVKRVYVVYDN